MLLPSLRSCIGTEATIVSHYVVFTWVQWNCKRCQTVGSPPLWGRSIYWIFVCLSTPKVTDLPIHLAVGSKLNVVLPCQIFFFHPNPRETCNYDALAERPFNLAHLRATLIYILPHAKGKRSCAHFAINITSTVIKSYTLNSARHGEIWMHTSTNPIPAVIPNLYATVTTCPSRTLIISLAENMTRVPGTADQYKTLHCHSQYYGKWQLWTNFEQFHGWAPIASWQQGVYDGSDTGSLATHLRYCLHLAHSFTPTSVDVPFMQLQRKPVKRGNRFVCFSG